jgi:hypothetical protein
MQKLFGSQRFLAIYSGVLTLVFLGMILSGLAQTAVPKKVSFDEIDVHRINVVEPDGTLRLVISNKANFPGIIIKGQEHLHPNRTTGGMLFFNDEGTENGGMIWGGSKDKDGKVSNYGHLSFDEYEQDQVFSIDAEQSGDKRDQSLRFNDNPDYLIGDLLALLDRTKDLPANQKKAEQQKFFQTHGSPHTRLSIERDVDKSVSFKLKDTDGKNRLVIQVAADGTPVIKFLDATGKVISQLPTTPNP